MKRRMNWIVTLMLVFTITLGVTAFAPFVSEASANQLYAQEIQIDNSQIKQETIEDSINSFVKDLKNKGINLRKIKSITITPNDKKFTVLRAILCETKTDCPLFKNGHPLDDCLQGQCSYL